MPCSLVGQPPCPGNGREPGIRRLSQGLPLSPGPLVSGWAPVEVSSPPSSAPHKWHHPWWRSKALTLPVSTFPISLALYSLLCKMGSQKWTEKVALPAQEPVVEFGGHGVGW